MMKFTIILRYLSCVFTSQCCSRNVDSKTTARTRQDTPPVSSEDAHSSP